MMVSRQRKKISGFPFLDGRLPWSNSNDWTTSSEGQRAPPGHFQWQSYVGMGQVPAERTATATSFFEEPPEAT